MTESSAWSTLRGHLKRPGVHIQRLEDSMATGLPDANICYRGHEIWLEGKYLGRLPVRLTTMVKVGLRAEQATWLEDRTLAGGTCMVWVRIEGEGWLLVENDFRLLVGGVLWEDMLSKWLLFPNAKLMANYILRR